MQIFMALIIIVFIAGLIIITLFVIYSIIALTIDELHNRSCDYPIDRWKRARKKHIKLSIKLHKKTLKKNMKAELKAYKNKINNDSIMLCEEFTKQYVSDHGLE